MQKNVFSPHSPHDDTMISSIQVAEESAHETIREIRHKLSHAISPDHGAAHTAEEGLHNGAHHAGQMMDHIEEKAKEALSPLKLHSSPAEDEDEGWMSDREGEVQSSSQGNRRSKSPKIKPPKLAVLRPGARRRASIRRGMLGARTIGRPHIDETMPSSQSLPELTIPSSPRTTEIDLSPDDAQDRGRRSTPIGSAYSTIASRRMPRHARIDSLRSINTTSRPSLREASPARSIRWADHPETEYYSHGRSGSHTPRIMSPSSPITPLPGSEAGSEDEGEGEPATGPTVRFDLPDPPPTSNRS